MSDEYTQEQLDEGRKARNEILSLWLQDGIYEKLTNMLNLLNDEFIKKHDFTEDIKVLLQIETGQLISQYMLFSIGKGLLDNKMMNIRQITDMLEKNNKKVVRAIKENKSTPH